MRLATKWVGSEGLNHIQTNNQPIHTDDNWKIEFHQGRIFRPKKSIERTIDLSEYEIYLSDILDELRDADLLPSSYKFRLGINDSSIDVKYLGVQ